MASSEEMDQAAGAPAGPRPPVPSASGATASGGATIAASSAPASERFDEILVRLRGVVEKLESGNLSLEDSLKFFEEGIGLCRRGAGILDSAERKVEVLLSGSAAEARGAAGPAGARTAPFEVPPSDED